MSPSVRLICYPGGDGSFATHASLTLRIDLPDSYSPAEVVQEIERRLRATYPLASIVVEEDAGDGGEVTAMPTWHVYRDGTTPTA
jgi:hypothetical protein